MTSRCTGWETLPWENKEKDTCHTRISLKDTIIKTTSNHKLQRLLCPQREAESTPFTYVCNCSNKATSEHQLQKYDK